MLLIIILFLVESGKKKKKNKSQIEEAEAIGMMNCFIIYLLFYC